MRRHRVLRLPIIRGVVALGGSMAIGFRALEVSANAQLPPEEGESEAKDIPKAVWAGTVILAIAMAVVLFFLIPVGLTSLIKDQLSNSSLLFWLIEGVIGQRSSSATCCCSRVCAICAGCSSTTAPSTRRSRASRPALT